MPTSACVVWLESLAGTRSSQFRRHLVRHSLKTPSAQTKQGLSEVTDCGLKGSCSQSGRWRQEGNRWTLSQGSWGSGGAGPWGQGMRGRRVALSSAV